MIHWGDVLFALLLLIIGIAVLRLWNSTVIEFLTTKNERKKRKKGQTFWDWLFYKRYISILPLFMLIFYYVMLFAGSALVFVSIVLDIMNVNNSIRRAIIYQGLIYLVFIPALILEIISFDFHAPFCRNVGKWLKKPKK